MAGNRFSRAFAWWFIGTVPFLLGTFFGLFFLPRQENPVRASRNVLTDFTPWDGYWYEQICRDGYSYDPHVPSSTAFFPGYPLLAWVVRKSTGLSVAVSLLIVSQVSLLCCYIAFDVYLEERSRTMAEPGLQELAPAVICLFPTTYTWHFAYSESLFVFISVGAFALMSRRAHFVVVAATVGMATAVRPTGIALLIPLWIYTWESMRNWKMALARIIATVPIAVWGLLAFMAYQWVSFGTPLAFIQTQELWARQVPRSALDKLLALLSFEPVWSVYVPGYRGYWRSQDIANVPAMYSMYFLNSVYCLSAAALLFVGYVKRWLAPKELAAGVGFLVLTYCLNAHEQMMQSQARYASIIFPAHFVLAIILGRLGIKARLSFAAAAASLLFSYSALMVAWFRVC